MTPVATMPVTTERSRGRRLSHDPRSALGLSARDLRVLTFVGRMGVVAQYQIHVFAFADVSQVVVSRCTKRLRRIGLVEVLRWNRTGVNLLRITKAGLDLATREGGVSEKALFQMKWPAPAALAHQLWLIDVVLALQDVVPTFDVLPCWALRRRFAGEKVPIPDVLAVSADGRRLLAIEVDLGGENLRKVFVPKLAGLVDAVASWAPGAQTLVRVFTVGEQRAATLRSLLAGAGMPAVVGVLPASIGREAVGCLVELFRAP